MPAALSDLFKKFTKQNNAGGGACAFIAFTHGYNYTVGANAITPDGARRAACAYMAQQPDRFHPYVEREYDRFELEEGVKVKNFAEYIQYMRIPNSWGGPAELTALGEAYGVDVAVFDTRFNKFTDLVSGNPSKVCLYLSGNHYEALIPKCSGNPNPVERIYQFNGEKHFCPFPFPFQFTKDLDSFQSMANCDKSIPMTIASRTSRTISK